MAYILPRKDEHVFHDMDGAAGLLPSRREYENEENSEKNDVYSDREINLDLADEIETLETQSQTTVRSYPNVLDTILIDVAARAGRKVGQKATKRLS